MKTKLPSEKIITIWRIGYIKLYNDQGDQENEDVVFLDDNDEWEKLFWRFYWRVS